MLKGKTIIVAGAASGIGAATAALVASQGANVISVDINSPATQVGRFIQADLSDKASIERLVVVLPTGVNGLANIAGLPPTRSPEQVLKVNLVGLVPDQPTRPQARRRRVHSQSRFAGRLRLGRGQRSSAGEQQSRFR